MSLNNSLTKQTGKVTFSDFLAQAAIRNKIKQMTNGNDAGFSASIISAVSTNPSLAVCDNATILSCALLGEALKLSPSPQLGQFYIVPFRDNKLNRTVGTFQLGYKGYVQLAMRSGQYRKLNVLSIKEGELIKYDPLNEEIEVSLIDDDTVRENTPTIGYYAMFEYTNGFRKTMYWSKKKMEAHAEKYSMGYRAKKGYTFWEKDFDGMAYKTMLRQIISKWGIMSIELQKAYEGDMAVIRQTDDNQLVPDNYADNLPETDFVQQPEVIAETKQEPKPETKPVEVVPEDDPLADKPEETKVVNRISQLKAEAKAEIIDWESPISIAKALNHIDTLAEYNKFKKINKARIEQVSADNSVKTALDETEERLSKAGK